VTRTPAARGAIKLWDTANKVKAIPNPTNWDLLGMGNTMPAVVFAEGLLEGAALMEVKLTLQITKTVNNQQVAGSTAGQGFRRGAACK
jgi:hypothetical protein